MNGTSRIMMAVGVTVTIVCTSTAVALARSAPTGTPAALPAPQAVDPEAWSDFDDDGFRDLAIGAPGAAVVTSSATVEEAGKVVVLYGSATGLSTARAQVWHQDVPGIAFGPGTGDHFGSALASGDFDQDGVGDLAIGVPDENRFIGGAVRTDAGLVEVIYGTAGVGLTATGSRAITPTDTQFPDDEQSLHWVGSRFGAALVALDWYDTVAPVDEAPDGFADLAIGAPGFKDGKGLFVALAGQDVASNPTFRGFVDFDVFFFFPAGARPATSLAAGNFNDAGFDDLAVGCPSCDVDDGTEVHANAGMVIVFNFVTAQFLFEGFDGSPATPDSNDAFGAAIAAGDFNGDGKDELAVGVPGKDIGSTRFAGQVQIYTGTDTGLEAPVRTVDEAAAAVPSEPVTFERFGQTLAVGNFGRGPGLDLAVGTPRERVGSVRDAGAVFVFYNTGSGLTAVDSQRWTQNTTGIPNSSETSDLFGSSVAVGQFQRGGTHDLVIGVPLEDLPGNNTFANDGLVHVLYGSGANGLRATNDQTFSMGSVGQPGLKESRFGAALR